MKYLKQQQTWEYMVLVVIYKVLRGTGEIGLLC